MNTPLNTTPAVKRPSRTWLWALGFIAMLALYGWVYYFEPLTALLSDYWNNVAADTLVLIPAVMAGILGIQLTRQFKPSEPPYRIWLTFTLGWWAWVGGELLGFVYDYVYWTTDYPEFTFIDVFWLLGYILFGLSLYYQFRLIYSSHGQGQKIIWYFVFIGMGLLLALGLTQGALAAGLGTEFSWPALYLAMIYPVFDLFEGAAALWLFFLFGRGYLGRPWWALIAFTFSDGISIFFWIGGYNWLSDQAYNIIDLSAAILYVAAYMIAALALFSASDHIRRSLSPSQNP